MSTLLGGSKRRAPFPSVPILSVANDGDLSYDVYEMPPQASIGQFEQLVLTAILQCGRNAYGVTIHECIETLSGAKAVSLGAVYATLDRLEDKGFISSWLSDPTPERGGRSKRCYRLESDGARALRESALTARRVCEVVEQAWGKGIWSGKYTPARQS